FSSRRRHTRWPRDWSSDVCSSDLEGYGMAGIENGTPNDDIRERLRNRVIAVPGTMTSAFLALQLYLGEFKYFVVPFDQIFETVRSEERRVGKECGGGWRGEGVSKY